MPAERLEITRPNGEFATPEEFLASFDIGKVPTTPGCYIMRDDSETVIYVGKANNLRSRLRSYLNETDTRPTVKFLMRRVKCIDFLVTRTEKEALLLENSLIKEHRPRYNVRLKDDKTYVSLRLDPREDFPRLTVVRRYKKDGARYFGPYSSSTAVRETLHQIRHTFPLRTCSDAVLNNRTRPCLYYQMKQCTAPCVNYIDRAGYHEISDQVVMLLEGRSADLEKTLTTQMEQHSERLEFEKAAALRDRLYALRQTLESQRTVRAGNDDDRDVFGLYTLGRFVEIQVLFYRGGKMMGGRSFSFNQRETPLEEVFASFLLQYYSEASAVPGEVLLPLPIEETDTLSEILTETRGSKVSVLWPQRGEKRDLIDLANRNAQSSFEEKRLADRANEDLLEHVRQSLQLAKIPNRIECFDISNIQGDKSVGSMVTFEAGLPCKARYRRFAIRTVEGQDDFAMMREILLRRYTKAVQENDLPDLVLIDGGKGQLGVAVTVLKDLGIEDLDVASIAKSRSLGDSKHSPERFFIPGRMNPIILPQNSAVVHLLARVRDEAHRFAITYHRKRRSAATLRSPLTGIPGVGPKRAKALLTTFGSLAKVRIASKEEIASVPGFNEKLAETIMQHLA
ncbi:MAG: excinuclease ABC subunit UvrC, partial [FCB group bacterium]|nr:excinuclease ABC subunit UvrC [FCB group bacterium]